MRWASLKKKSSKKWEKFKEKHPRVSEVAKGFFPSLYFQIPVIGSFIATRPEFIIPREQLPENLWLYLSLGTAALIPTIHLGKKIFKKLRGKKEERIDPKEKFVMIDIAGGAPSYVANTAIDRAITDSFTQNHLLYPPANLAVGNIVAYAGLSLLWYGTNRKYFRGVKHQREVNPEEKIGIFKRLKVFFAHGFYYSPAGWLVEKIGPESKLVGKIKEMSEEAKRIQENAQNTVSEDMIELLGIQRGGDLYLFPISMGILGIVLISGMSGPAAFALYFSITQPIRFANSLWKNAMGIALFNPRIEQKEEVKTSEA